MLKIHKNHKLIINYVFYDYLDLRVFFNFSFCIILSLFFQLLSSFIKTLNKNL